MFTTLSYLESAFEMENSNLDIGEINRDLQQSYIHYEPSRVDYTITNSELESLEHSGSNIWKDVFLASLGVGIPSLINGLVSLGDISLEKPMSLGLFLNLLVAGISLSLSIISLIIWKKDKGTFSKLINQIKSKPKYKLPSTGNAKI